MREDQQTDAVLAWVDGYVRAWNSNDPGAIGALFTDDATYHTEPYGEPWRGRDEIVRRWLGRRDEPGDTEFRWHPLTVTPEVAVVEGTTTYRDPPRTYSNLWVVRLAPDGRCTEFTEWWMQHPGATPA
jgi:uncharacterized protein (TIGR02246 family)